MLPSFKFFLIIRLLLLVFLVVILIFLFLNMAITSSLPIVQSPKPRVTAGKPISRTDGCVVDPETAKKVHGNYEEAGIQLVNDDNTVKVQTINTRITILFKVVPGELHCFRKSSIAPVTISKCKKNRKGECDFSLPHEVYVRTLPVKVIAWKYSKPAF